MKYLRYFENIDWEEEWDEDELDIITKEDLMNLTSDDVPSLLMFLKKIEMGRDPDSKPYDNETNKMEYRYYDEPLIGVNKQAGFITVNIHIPPTSKPHFIVNCYFKKDKNSDVLIYDHIVISSDKWEIPKKVDWDAQYNIEKNKIKVKPDHRDIYKKFIMYFVTEELVTKY
jgi:hypothetical protein